MAYVRLGGVYVTHMALSADDSVGTPTLSVGATPEQLLIFYQLIQFLSTQAKGRERRI